MATVRKTISISDLRAHAANLVQDLHAQRMPIAVTRRGKPMAVIQDVESYQETQTMVALLKVLVRGDREIRRGRVVPARRAIARLRSRRA